jgi:hypothetical protein
MPILGLVLLLDDAQSATRAHVASALSRAADLELGEPREHRWPVVLDVDSERDAELRIEALRSLEGISHVDVVYADFEDLLERPGMADAREEL